MESLLLVVHVLVGLAMIGLIMIQQGKGAEMGASFGAGSSQTVFGAAGSGNFWSRTTSVLAAAFFALSLLLAYLSKERIDDVVPDIPVIEETLPLPKVDVDESIPAATEVSIPDAVDGAIPAAPGAADVADEAKQD